MFFLDLRVMCVAACGMKFSHGFPTGGLQLETSNYVQPGGWNLFADYKAGTDLGESWSMRREDVRFCSYFCFFKPCRSQVRQPALQTLQCLQLALCLSSASDNGLSLSQTLGKNYVFLSLEPLRKLEFVCFEKFPKVFWRHNCLPMLEWT